MAVIQRLARGPTRRVRDVDQAAGELGFSRSQVYVLLHRYLVDPRLTSPCRAAVDRSTAVQLSDEIDQLVDESIETVYLVQQRPAISTWCRDSTTLPHAWAGRRLVAKRLLPACARSPVKRSVGRREDCKSARDRFGPDRITHRRYAPVLVQIDHTLVGLLWSITLPERLSSGPGSRLRLMSIRAASWAFICRSRRPLRPVRSCASLRLCYPRAIGLQSAKLMRSGRCTD